ncbi:MAG: bifunctional (p)ppGpp synthetase/guanosine-3',5'-bis(diphosphate) 3'-pyrophosphohydrolase [Xanthomonadales bacterium]|nr:bifunctional (p)ppGpp synthetase/guanosine-3',5'-bis(diphosphate) 3'-pyrophosphohydrolase [Xanthomonadales bacterium]
MTPRPTRQPASRRYPADVRALEQQLSSYLPARQVARVRKAYVIGARAHEGQTRKSGEPYITHPVAVARILAELGMDAETIIAAILHDTLEDTALSAAEITDTFSVTVAELVDGVTKLDKVRFRSRQEAAAESFRKMLLAMARDLRVILIKLADRLHNMRTLGSMEPEARRRIARETLDIYAPIAQRLGMNRFRLELQDLGFRSLYPDRHRIIAGRIRTVLGNRREAMLRIEEALNARLDAEGIGHRVGSRIKSPYSIYSKMQSDNRSFAQVMDVYGFRVVVADVRDCYHALGAVHALYKPLDGRFKDFIAIPKVNGYQSLHTVLFGPFGAPIEIQIRTEDMDAVAERGVAAHWVYKTDAPANSAQSRAREWVSGLVDRETQTPSSLEFIENVKVDLFPDEVYLFTPRGEIMSLPRNATALDFAYAVHTDVGDHAVAARADKKLIPLRTPLTSGQTVEIVTAPSAAPTPQWLDWVVSSRARTAIRHHLKRLQHEDAVDFGHRMLDRALDEVESSLEAIPRDVLDRYLGEQKYKRLEELLADIALGNRVAEAVAGQLLVARGEHPHAVRARKSEKILISGTERGVLSFGNCCHPLPGDEIMGYLSAGKGIVVHRMECPNVPEFRKHPERCVEIAWAPDVQGDYRVELRIEVSNKPGVLAQVAAAVADTGSNIENVEYKERDLSTASLLFTIEVRDRRHLAHVMRGVRRLQVVTGVKRYPV